MTITVVNKEQRTSDPVMVRLFYLNLLAHPHGDTEEAMNGLFTPEWKLIIADIPAEHIKEASARMSNS